MAKISARGAHEISRVKMLVSGRVFQYLLRSDGTMIYNPGWGWKATKKRFNGPDMVNTFREWAKNWIVQMGGKESV